MQANVNLLSFEEYAELCRHTSDRYELVNGELISVVPPSMHHHRIAKFLERYVEIKN